MSATNTIATNDAEDAVDVVVLDDDKLTLEIVSWILRSTEVSYKLFSDYHLAKSYIISAAPKLLVVDYYMPAGSGIDFINELKVLSDLSHTDIFLCSAITPRLADEHTMQSLGIRLLEKQVICDKAKFLSMIDSMA